MLRERLFGFVFWRLASCIKGVFEIFVCCKNLFEGFFESFGSSVQHDKDDFDIAAIAEQAKCAQMKHLRAFCYLTLVSVLFCLSPLGGQLFSALFVCVQRRL